MRYVKLNDLVDIISGQIMTRVKVNDSTDQFAEERRIIVPKAITDNGLIDLDQLSTEKLKVAADEKRLTQVGDIVIKLNSPYTSATITKETANCMVPSFCATIRLYNNLVIEPSYLQAFLNSASFRNQIENMVQGSMLTMLHVGKLRDVDVPVPDKLVQDSIGKEYRNTQYKLSLINEIEKLEKMKNDAIFYELEG
ncbi:MAG: hypothetical protein J6E46_01485 [Faecalicoccus sp.]|nr:hypothetical protein [Faecalicoccus sp.]